MQVSSDGPAPRNGTALAFDARRQTMIMSGGRPAFVGPETWEWDGAGWDVVPVDPPPGRFNPAVAAFGPLAAVVRFGGWTGSERSGDTWLFDESGWRDLAISGPSPRNHASMAFDPVRSRLVLMGGHDGTRVFGETWEFDGRSWLQVGHAEPRPRLDNGH